MGGGLRWTVGDRSNIQDARFAPPAVPTIADAVDGDRRKEPMNELAEALDRAATHIKDVPRGVEAAAIRQTLLALIDALTEIAAILPAPYTVPKETEGHV